MGARIVDAFENPRVRAQVASRFGLHVLGTILALAAAGPGAIADDKPAEAAKTAKPTEPSKPAKAAAKPRKAAKPAPPSPPRPPRTVTAPTITSADLDAKVAAFLAKNSPGVAPATATSDIEFVRRVYLDVSGSPPTPEQVRSFVSDRRPDKRARLIDDLLERPEYARNWAHYWREVVRFHATNQNQGQIRYDALEDWLAERLGENRPWDEIVAGLITATGRNDENGAVAFALANETKPVELAGEVSRIFMGVQIQCAQCHDHKTDSWKQEQFHEFAAFFAGTRTRRAEKPMKGQRAVFAVEPIPRTRYTRPDNDDPKKQIPVSPRFFLATSQSSQKLPEGMTTKQLRELAASYVTGQDNPWFARAFVNRIWSSLMGEGFYDVLDDLGPERVAKAPEILEPLADQWQKGGYDVRWLFRTLLNTKAYQRRVRATTSPAGRTQLAANCPSRLRSDQIYEALGLALGVPTEAGPDAGDRKPGKKAPVAAVLTSNGPGNVKKAAEAAGLGGSTAAKGQVKAARAAGLRNPFNTLFGVDPSTAPDEVLGTIPQALFLMNGPVVHNRTQAKPGTVLGRILASAPDDKAALDALYLRVLSRRPTAKEVQVCARYMADVGDRKEAFEDIYWSLVNTTEFLSRR
jgi:hypothetical protein